MQASDIEKFPLPEEPTPMPWYKIWWQVLTGPRVESYRQVLGSYRTGSKIHYLWLVVVGLISVLVVMPLYVFGIQPALGALLFEGRLLLLLLWIIIIVPFSTIISLVIMAGATHLAAKSVFKGAGSYSELEYLYGAVRAVYTCIGGIFSLLAVSIIFPQYFSYLFSAQSTGSSSAILLFSCCISILGMVMVVYQYLMQVVAVMTVHAIAWWKALISAVWLPVFFMLCGICFYAVTFISAVNSAMQ